MAVAFGDRGVKAVLAAAILAVATATIFVDGEVEVTLFMVSAVITCLICFDVALTRQVRSFWPWLLVSIAPIAKAAPTVWYDLNEDSGLSFERYDHAGSILVAGCVFVAVAVLARPAADVQARDARVGGAIIAASGVGIAVSAASVSFVFESGFGSERVARSMEAIGWGLAAAIVAASVAGISRTAKPRPALVGFLLTSLGLAACLALSSAGRAFDLGWWSLIFAGFAATASWFPSAALGERAERTRPTGAMSVVAAVGAVVTAGAAIGARGDRAAWSPGWIILGVVSIGLFWSALAAKAHFQPPATSAADDDDDGAPTPTLAPSAPHTASTPALAPAGAASAGIESAGVAPTTPDSPSQGAAAATTSVAAGRPTQPDPPAAATAIDGPFASRAAATASAATGARSAGSGRAAAARNAARTHRRPAEPHHFDPATGLLSAAGLQHYLVDTFGVSHGRGDVALVLLAIRNLDRIESEHGRVNSAAISLEVADRLRALVPEGRIARFARAAYAVVIIGHAEPPDMINRIARALKAVSADVAVGNGLAEIDVVAGMTQCYSDEDAARFVTRANLALERAVQTPEAALVVMP